MIGSGELIVILCLVMLLFGGKKLPEFARSLGEGIREFKKACNPEDETPKSMPEKKTSREIEVQSKKADSADTP